MLKRFVYLELEGGVPWREEAWNRYGFKPFLPALPYLGPEIKPATHQSDPRTYLTALSDEEAIIRLCLKYRPQEARNIVMNWRQIMGVHRPTRIVWTTSDKWLVFFVPWLVGQNRTAEEQLEMLKGMQRFHRLPDYHLSSFGSAHLLAALCLAYMRENGGKNLLSGQWVRTDTPHYNDGARIALFGDAGEVHMGYDLHGSAAHHIAVVPVTVEIL